MDASSLKDLELFEDIDVRFAHFIGRLHPETDPAVMVAAAVLSAATGRGDICVDLSEPLRFAENDPSARTDPTALLPEPSRLKALLAAHPAVAPPGQVAPMVLDGRGRLYLYRYWRYERRLADVFTRRMTGILDDPPAQGLQDTIGRLFPESAGKPIEGQVLAAVTAALKPMCVISGGPGTGKTTVAARIAALLLRLFGARRFRILLAAPTGKAAARLGESMAAATGKIDCAETVRRAVPTEARTLHRLLGTVPGSSDFRHDRDNPLAADAVIVDEASMVDVALMAKLVDALPEQCRLILMGDRDQLASVEAGAVLGDLCGKNREPGISRPWADALRGAVGIGPAKNIARTGSCPGPADAVVLMTRNFRFSADSGIGRFSRRVRRGDAAGALCISRRSADREPVIWFDAASDAGSLSALLKRSVLQGYERFFTAPSPEKALELAAGFKILCAVNRGPLGVGALNDSARRMLQQQGLIKADADLWYQGRPVMITRNDYGLGLFNGDLGVVHRDATSGDLRVFFPGEAGRMRAVSPHRLSEHQTAFAMTVHKSQGSEFDEILLVLPETDNPVLTRELIYTAVTRARKRVTICGTEPILTAAVRRRVRRVSGLSDALWTDQR